jgi:hypothetical protein
MSTQDDGESNKINDNGEGAEMQHCLESMGFVGVEAFDPMAFYRQHYAGSDSDNAE